jgi:hypothetical protein
MCCSPPAFTVASWDSSCPCCTRIESPSRDIFGLLVSLWWSHTAAEPVMHHLAPLPLLMC